jgi:hypothetical protein
MNIHGHAPSWWTKSVYISAKFLPRSRPLAEGRPPSAAHVDGGGDQISSGPAHLVIYPAGRGAKFNRIRRGVVRKSAGGGRRASVCPPFEFSSRTLK